MKITNGDIIRTMNNENLAKFLYVLLERIQKPTSDSVVKSIETWLDEDYYSEEKEK
jgi:hypothetical protein